MQIHRLIPVHQVSDQMEQIAIKNNTTVSTCGYITCAIVQYLAEHQDFTPELLHNLNFHILQPYVVKVMQSIAKTRRLEVKKFMNKMNDSQKKNYIKDWVANFQVADYLESIQQKSVNHNVYFFRQVSHDHPDAVANTKFEEAERVKEQLEFKGGIYFYTSFGPMKNHFKEQFQEQLKQNHQKQRPVIISTDVLGHFNTTVLIKGTVYVLDSLPNVPDQYDTGILQAICHYYKRSYLKQ